MRARLAPVRVLQFFLHAAAKCHKTAKNYSIHDIIMTTRRERNIAIISPRPRPIRTTTKTKKAKRNSVYFNHAPRWCVRGALRRLPKFWFANRRAGAVRAWSRAGQSRAQSHAATPSGAHLQMGNPHLGHGRPFGHSCAGTLLALQVVRGPGAGPGPGGPGSGPGPAIAPTAASG